ncbi:MAG: class I SAM-dependent methyltransferase [Candidatus Yanofskybacteria bacterium]|nr:class I SAM-dependent methyltransferase [Candidatus Yanofskybacteria bacterium]
MICILCKKHTNDVITKELRGGEKLPVFYCKRCDIGMLGQELSGEELKKYYAGKYRKIASPRLGFATNPKELFETAIPFQQDRVRLLKKHLGKNRRLLEVGCSAGMFLWHIRKYVKEAIGIDYDSRSAKFAARKCGCKTYDKDIERTDLEKKSFDIICAFQTLEHVKNPVDFIARYKKYLKPGGVMAIEVPNLRDALVYAYDLPNHKKFFYHISHTWYFSQKSLQKLMKQSGFRGEVFHIQDYNIFNHINWIINDKPQPSFSPGLASPVVNFRKNIELKIKSEISRFVIKMDESYKNKLSDLKITSNIFYIGRIK